MQKFDICVIGVGTVGAFAGYYLAKKGLKTALVDIYSPPHDKGSYHGDTRIFRIAYGEGEKYIPMLKRAFDLWGEFEKETDTKLFERCGVINIGHKNSDFMINIIKSVNDYKLDCEIIDKKEIEERYKFFVPNDFIGVYEKNTGYVYSDKSIITASNEAKKLGAKEYYNEEITEIKKNNNSYLIISKNYEFETKNIVLSAGTYSDEILNLLLKIMPLPCIPIFKKRKIFSWWKSEEYIYGKLPAFTFEIDGDHYYGFPNAGDGFKIGKNLSGQYYNKREERVPFGELEEDRNEIGEHARKFMHYIGDFIEGKSCSYPMSLDEDFIIDFLNKDILFFGGLSHGFKFATVLGELAMKAFTEKDFKLDNNFTLKRFN